MIIKCRREKKWRETFYVEKFIKERHIITHHLFSMSVRVKSMMTLMTDYQYSWSIAIAKQDERFVLGEQRSSGRNRLTPNRPSFVCAINRFVLTTSAAPRQGEEFVRRPGRARPPESIGSHKHPLYNPAANPMENWFPSPFLWLALSM